MEVVVILDAMLLPPDVSEHQGRIQIIKEKLT